jgi:hypothetical protein
MLFGEEDHNRYRFTIDAAHVLWKAMQFEWVKERKHVMAIKLSSICSSADGFMGDVCRPFKLKAVRLNPAVCLASS